MNISNLLVCKERWYFVYWIGFQICQRDRHVIDAFRTRNVNATRSLLTFGQKWVFCWFKGCGMGPWLVLVSPCFRENVAAICKIWSFLCSLDYLLQKNVIYSLFWKSNYKMALIEKRAIFDLLFAFSSHQGKVTKIPLAHILNTYIHVFCLPYWLFLPYQFWKKYEFITVSLWYESWCWFLFVPFWNNQ